MRLGQDRSFYPRPGLALLITLFALGSLPAPGRAEPIHVHTRSSSTLQDGAREAVVTVANFHASVAGNPSAGIHAQEAERSPYPQHSGCNEPPPGVPEPAAASLAISALGALWLARMIRKTKRAEQG